MNKDKVIKDLKERNDSLKNQYRLRDIRCVCLEDEVQEQKKEIERLNKIIQIKQNRINKLNIINDTQLTIFDLIDEENDKK